MTKPIATARYNRYVVVEFDKGADADHMRGLVHMDHG
jgi:hypothetical protein